jgi:ParB family chromosome partitioning protein
LIPTAPTGPDANSGRSVGFPASTGSGTTALLAHPDGEPHDLATAAGAYFAEIPLSAVRPNPRQPRQVFDPDALDELVASLKQVGLLQPIVVRGVGQDQYELIMGERRWRACGLAGLETVPAIVRRTEDDSMLIDALLENLHRAALNPLEEAAAYDQLLRDFDCTHDVLAARVGKSRSQISNTVRLLKLPPAVQLRVAAGVLSAGHARALLGLDGAHEQERLAQRIVAEGLSVRAVEELVAVGEAKGPRPRRAPAAVEDSPALEAMAAVLEDGLDTRVKIQMGRGRGRMTIEFASVEDLERIVSMIVPPDARTPRPGAGHPLEH